MDNSGNTNNNRPGNIWEFLQTFAPNGPFAAGVGIDHANSMPQFPPGFPFHNTEFNNDSWNGQGWGGWGGPWGHHGWRGSNGRPNPRDAPESGGEDDHDMDGETDTMRPTPDESVNSDVPPPPRASGAFSPPPPPPPPGAPNHPPRGPFHHGHPHPFGPRRGGPWGRRGGRRGHHHHQPPPPPPPFGGPWDFRPLMESFASHPYAQAFRNCMDQTRSGPSDSSAEDQINSFTPPVDVFNTDKAYVLHVSLPGALKEDIGVNWDGEKINIAGVVYRPGNEEFLQTMASSERKVGMFERSIKLPPAGSDEKEDIDGLGITAKMENGILIVTVPKTEKEWTAIHKIDIE